MKRLLAGLALLTLAACGAGEGNSDYSVVFQTLRAGIFNRNAEGPPQFSATRQTLIEAGITDPVLVARLPDAGISVGLIRFREVRGVEVWRSLDGNTISTAGGALRNTRGFGIDLHSLETQGLLEALANGQEADYARIYRALDGMGVEQAFRLYCHLVPGGRERVDVLGRGYDTVRFTESCHVADRPEPVFENIYWRGSGGIVWKSRQWAGPELGYAVLERVIN